MIVTDPRIDVAASGRSRRQRLVLMLGVAVGAVAAGLPLVWRPSPWVDEAATRSAVDRSWRQFFELVRNVDAVHATYYACARVMAVLIGSDIDRLRLLSVVCMAGAAVMVARTALQLVDRRFAVMSAAATVALPSGTWMVTQARSAAMATLLAVVATAALLNAVHSRTARSWFGYGCAVTGLVLVFAFGGLLVLAHLCTVLLLRRREALVPWSGSIAGAGVLLSPFAGLLYSQRGQVAWIDAHHATVGSTPATHKGLVQSALGFLRNVVLNQFFGGSVLLASVVALVVLIALVRSRFRAMSDPVLAVAVPWLLVPPAILGVAGVLGEEFYIPRYMAYCTPAMALVLSWAVLAALRAMAQQVAAAAVVLTMCIPGWVGSRQVDANAGSDWSTAASVIESRVQGGDAIAFAGPVDGWGPNGLKAAYPSLVQVAHEVGLISTGRDTARLWDETAPPTAEEVAGASRLWVASTPGQFPDEAAAVKNRAVSLGFHSVYLWNGVTTEVELWER